MDILLTGGTGLIGRALCRRLLAQGHRLTVLSRKPERVAALCGAGVAAWHTLQQWQPGIAFDAVINLAGEPIADAAWTQRRKQALRDSRVTLTEALVQRIAAAERKPAVLLSGSAIGYYGDCGDAVLDEESPCGNDFAATLCRDWEQAALAAETSGVRVCLLRTGLVLSTEGGLLGRMLLPFRLGLGARLGDGRQWMSWIHIDDYVAALGLMLQQETMRGAYGMTAPEPVRNADFTRQLAAVLQRPQWLTAPAFALKLALGERAALLLGSQRVLPARLKAQGYAFSYPELAGALRHLLGR